jgi:pyruvate-formate lyase/deferrochelatase/peroxidase EfeB
MEPSDATVLTAQQVKYLSGERDNVAEVRTFSERDDLALRYSQTGLPYASEHCVYLTVFLTEPVRLGLDRFKQLAGDLERSAREEHFAWVTTVACSLELWRKWSDENGLPLCHRLFEGESELRQTLMRKPSPLALTGGDLFFQIQARDAARALKIKDRIMSFLADIIDESRTFSIVGDSLHRGRLYGGRMLHGLIGSVEPVGFSARAVIGDELAQHKGGCFCLTQKFVHDWQQLSGMSDLEIENLIGRSHHGNIILSDDERCHVKAVRVSNEDGVNYRLVGQSQPFRTEKMVDGGYGREEGIVQLAYAKSLEAFTRVLQSMLGNKDGYIKSRHFQVSRAYLGNYWYVPSALELGMPDPHPFLSVPMNSFFGVRSENGRMYYNTKDYLNKVGNRVASPWMEPSPTDRVVELLGYTFSRWHDTWYHRRPAPELGHLEDYVGNVKHLSVAERKGMSVKKTLELLSSYPLGGKFDTYRIHPREIIVGVVPDFTLGSGFEAMRYLNPDEKPDAFLMRLDEAGSAGHNVPGYKKVLEEGIGATLKDVQRRHDAAVDGEARQFYQSAIYSLEGVQAYLHNYAVLSRKKRRDMVNGSARDRANLTEISKRMQRLSSKPPESFVDAVQLIFSMHCAMHIAGELVSIGRLDQLLAPFYDADKMTPEEAQEVIDCFWVKMDEKVLLNHRNFSDRLSRGSGAITYQGGDFPQGAALNQWVQQVTVGGYKSNNSDTPEDACNEITLMCLRSARRLPLNAPCLSLRVHPGIPEEVVEEAAACILSGGAHPLLINDDKVLAGLLRSGSGADLRDSAVGIADARDMVCDGCFEPIVAGKCEFAFGFVPVPDAIEMALNRGRTFADAGPVHLAGMKASFRSRCPEQIESWEEFYQIFLEHYRFKLIEFYAGMLSRYGNLSKVCPSPLLSCFIDGCLEKGRDLTSGGARYKFLAPLMNGITCAIDSLWAIKLLVFSDEALFSLPELVKCLICDWGHDMKEPFCCSTGGEDRIVVEGERFRHLRRHALKLKKFGAGDPKVDEFARQLVRDLVEMVYDLYWHAQGSSARRMDELCAVYSTAQDPFRFIITPGIATFEDYAGVGSFLGASADGRRSRQAVGSDMSPSPTPSDLPVAAQGRNIREALKSWSAPDALQLEEDHAHRDPIGIGLSNGSPVDINIRESFPVEELQSLIRSFASGEIGSNMLSITCANPETLLKAQETPECYDLVRMRMGGWSEFFVAMFPEHQEHHKRRPIFEFSIE